MSNNQMPISMHNAPANPVGSDRHPDYSVLHENIARQYADVWKPASSNTLSRTLMVLLLVIVIILFSIPILQSSVGIVLKNVDGIASSL